MILSAFNNRKSLFIPFIMSGYPSLETSTKALITLANAGCDIIELGVPFSDPIADGPVNQKAATIAIKNGMTLKKVLQQVQEFRMHGYKTPIILFSYLNPIYAFGYENFYKEALDAGVNGVLVVDLPPEEGQDFYMGAKHAGLEIALLISPTTNFKRLTTYKYLQPSFIYYISRLAVTGAKSDISNSLETELKNLRSLFPETKIAVGFGISSTKQANYVSEIADGVIVGSKLVDTLNSGGIKMFSHLVHDFKKSIHDLCT